MKKGLSWFQRLTLLACGSVLLAGCPGTDGQDRARTALTGLTLDVEQGGAKVCEVPDNDAALVNRVLELINVERAKYDLPPVTMNPLLSQIAADFCCDMIEGGFFPKDHINPDTGEGTYDRAVKGGYEFLAVGENLAAGQTSPEEAVTDWLNSPEHRNIILGAQWSEVGIAVRIGGEYGVYWVQEFGNPP